VQSPLVETNTSPLGVAFATLTASASDGPLLVMLSVYVTVLPGTTDAEPVAVIATSADGTSASLAVALLFPAGSFVPTGAATVAVLASVPVALAEIVPVAVNVTVPPLSTFTLAARFPLPLAAGQAEPAVAVQLQVTPLMIAGKLSVTVAPVTALGPALLTAMVQVAADPGTGVPELSALVIDRSAVGVMTVLASVAELLPAGSLVPTGAVIVAVFEIVPDPLAVAVTVKVAVPPESRFTPAETLPVPLAGQLDPALAAQVQLALVTVAGKMSVTVAPVTADGPAFDATMV